MGFFSELFGGRRRIDTLLNPVLGMKLREFAVIDDDPTWMKHYFRYTNKEGEEEEFITVYRRINRTAIYERTHWRKRPSRPEFVTLSESGPWSMTISHLIREGDRLGPRTASTRGHLASKVAGTDIVLRPLQKAATAVTPPPSPTPRQPADDTRVRAAAWRADEVDTGDEKIRCIELSRSYQFGGLSGEKSQASLRIVLTLEGALIPEGLSFNRRLRFYLWPFRLPHEADFSMRLATADGSRGGVFSVLAAPLETDNETAMIARYAGKDDVARCIEAFAAGQPLRFNLEDEKESLVGFMLPNDGTFKALYEQCQAKVTSAAREEPAEEECEEPPNPEEIRRNPKAYAVWMIDGDANDYRVLLVRLGPSEKMETCWTVGQRFATRDEQGSYALSMARELRIPLMDVVKNT